MFSKFYFFLKSQTDRIESKLAETIAQDLTKPYQSKLFSFGIIFSNLSLAFLNILADLLKFFIIMLSDSGEGFNVLFKQKELTSCPYSYHNYKLIRQKIRTFSFSTLAALIIATGISTLVLNLWLGGRLPGFAATFSFTQTNWSSGASSTATAKHSANQTGWQNFSTSSSNVTIDGSGKVTLLPTTATSTLDDTDANFNAGTKTNNLYASGGRLYLQKPFGASCTANSQCMDGAGANYGWCYGNICRSPWIVGPVPNLAVMSLNLTTTYVWQTIIGSCQSPQCNSMTLVDPIANPSVDFSNYPAQNACKAIGGRLPTLSEWMNIYSNIGSYSIRGAFPGFYYHTSTEANSSSNHTGYSGDNRTFIASKNTSYHVRCVKTQ